MSRIDGTRRQVLKAVPAVGASGFLAGCGGGGDSGDGIAGEDRTLVDMVDTLIFQPDSVEIEVGETIIWSNQGSMDHSVAAYEDELPDAAEYFASGDFDAEQAARDGWENGEGHIGSNETYDHTFEVPGTYEYFCVPHEDTMTGTIEVVEPTTES